VPGAPTLLAALAGVCAAGAIVELAEARAGRSRGRRGSRILRLLALLGRRAGRAPAPADLGARIDAAGSPLGLAVADVMALKGGAAVAGGLGALTAAAVAPGRLGPLVLVAGPALGFFAPDLVLRRLARQRAETMALELADVAELLRVAVDAGLTPMRALAEVGRRHSGLLAAELRAVAARVALGVPREEVLERLAARAPVAGVHALVAALGRAERHGAPLGPVLGALAAEARGERARRVRDRAARAAPKIQLVVALLLVPAVLLMVAASLAAALL
jgi:tight adherence protein C